MRNSEIESLKANQEKYEKEKYKEGLKKGYKAGLEGGKLYGLAMATTPIISRDLDKIKKESTKNKIRENTEAFLDTDNKLLIPIYDRNDAPSIAEGIYDLQIQGNDILDNKYFSDDRKKDIDATEKKIITLKDEIKELEDNIKIIKRSPNKINLKTLNSRKEQLGREEKKLFDLYKPVEDKIKGDISNNRINPVDRILMGMKKKN